MAYETSELYKEAIDKLTKSTRVSGTLTTKSGTTVEIKTENIDIGSAYITNQCVNSDAFRYGSVFSAEMGITLKNIEVDKYSLFDAEIEISYGLLLSNGEYEDIPLGVFYVNEPSRIGKNISIKAYDGMIKLEENIEESTTGTPYDLLRYISEKCDVKLSQNEDDILALTNGNMLLSVDSSRVDTFRSLLSYIAQITCTFAVFDRKGKLKLCEFSTEQTKVIIPKLKTTSKFSDFETYFSGIKGSFISNSVYKSYLYNDPDKNEGLLYDVGEIPVVQGLDETNQKVLEDMYSNLSVIKYTPCDFTFNGDPSIDLGDMLLNEDRFGNKVVSLVTFYKWTFRGGHQIKSAGANPKLLSVKEKKNKDIANLQAEIEAKTVAVYSFTNASKITFKGGEAEVDMEELLKIAFAVNDDVTALFMATISLSIDCDGFVEFTSFLDGVLYEGSTICQYFLKGEHVVTFMNYIPCKKNFTYRFSVKARSYAEETEFRKDQAKIKTNENARDALVQNYSSLALALKSATSVPLTNISDAVQYNVVEADKTVPTVTIDRYKEKAVIFGQGLAAKAPWDGTIAVSDKFNKTYCPGFDILASDEMLFALLDDKKNGFSESIKIKVDDITVLPKTFNNNVTTETEE